MIAFFSFGTQSTIYYAGPANVTGLNGEQLCLAFKISVGYFFFPLSITRDGYVLGITFIKNDKRFIDRKRFYPLTNISLKAYQDEGYIAKELPYVKTPISDKIFVGFGWFITGIIAIGGIASLIGK